MCKRTFPAYDESEKENEEGIDWDDDGLSGE